MRMVGLYAGIGGFELGFEKAGFEPVLLADKDENCRRVLGTRFEGVAVAGDVADIDDLPSDIEVVTAGFPCQNLSMAGDKAGIEGEKSRDVRHLFDLLKASRPTLVIENVYFMLQLKGGSAMDALVQQVEALGYRWAYRVVNTLAFGLPQRRRRVVFVASATIDPTAVLFADEAPPPPARPVSLEEPLGFYWTEGRSGIGFAVDSIPPLKVASGLGIPSTPAVLFPDGRVLVPSIEVCERLQGFPPGWTDVDFDARRSPRWMMVGNAVSVPVAEWIGSRVALPGDVSNLRSAGLPPRSRWPSAAYGTRDGRFSVDASEFPVSLPATSIVNYELGSWRPLSVRALRGFVSRVKAGGLRTPEGFVSRLEEAIAEGAAAID